ncbi:hypothetical protein BDP27DRAFT_1320618 [Rhodocollybia butyracea]|uniref:Secreted protein n=1 Tax=Rhodocollybia butyracea TaxID=206335 RepID=A0A9P5Q182_9AGAR|nr:hypothetical protein BDP27DRAFT_1320614 [Rhodocollybia butyracea]KAF9072237.1 hypothetical protein BDP27DRAFT_1320617 [Rhodocollybia butyracea]KAF9072241.1 hypothetical protein BDP27DRAFT_1320618 [Rhodocollybia butyracea]
MRLNLIFVILGFVFTINAIPLADSPVSITRRDTDQGLKLKIAITFENESKNPSAKTPAPDARKQSDYTNDIRQDVTDLVDTAFYYAIHKHQLKVDPFDKIDPDSDYHREYSWVNDPLLGAPYSTPAQRSNLKWELTFSKDSKEYRHTGRGTIGTSSDVKGWALGTITTGQEGRDGQIFRKYIKVTAAKKGTLTWERW